MLEQMERALVEEDPKFASTLRGTSMRHHARRRAILAALGFLVGVAVLLAGGVTQLWYVGILGFVVMLASATIGLTAVRGQSSSSSTTVPNDVSGAEHPSTGFSVIDGGRKQRRPKQRSQHSFMERLEERWRRRRESGGY